MPSQSESLSWLASHGVRIGAVLLVALIVTFASRSLAKLFLRRSERPADETIEERVQRSATVSQAFARAIRVVVWFVATLMILGELGLNLAPLLAGASVAGVALGFGAQSVIRDVLAGLFMLVENQVHVGDVVQVQAIMRVVEGRVEAMTLRMLALRDFDGTLHIIPNGQIVMLGNRSRGWARAIVDVPVKPGRGLVEAEDVLSRLTEKIEHDTTLNRGLLGKPAVLGVEQLNADTVVVRIVADTKPSRRSDVERRLRRLVTDGLGEAATATGDGRGRSSSRAPRQRSNGRRSEPAGRR